MHTDKTINYYQSSSNKRWKVRVHDMMIRDEGADAKTYKSLNPDNDGTHYADAMVDTFYRAMLIPSILWPNF